jgi:hypothetical protein
VWDIKLNLGDKGIAKVSEVFQQFGVWIVGPGATVRQAKADADAMKILAKAEGQVTDLRYRAAWRLADQEARRQENREATAQEIAKALPDQVSEEPVDPDWINFFGECCQDVSDEQMRKLWGRIGAAEIAKPNSFSRRTLSAVKHLSPQEKELFEKLMSKVWRGSHRTLVPIDHFEGFETLKEFKLYYGDLLILNAAGLSHLDSAQIELPAGTALVAGSDAIVFGKTIPEFVYLPLTPAGEELSRVVLVEPDYGFHESQIGRMRMFQPASIWPHPGDVEDEA